MARQLYGVSIPLNLCNSVRIFGVSQRILLFKRIPRLIVVFERKEQIQAITAVNKILVGNIWRFLSMSCYCPNIFGISGTMTHMALGQSSDVC